MLWAQHLRRAAGWALLHHERREQAVRGLTVRYAVIPVLAVALLAVSPAGAQINLRPAPTGSPSAVAARVIAKAGHPCPRVMSARRMADGGIAATCSNRELYLIATIDRVGPVAMRCSAAKRLLGVSCLK